MGRLLIRIDLRADLPLHNDLIGRPFNKHCIRCRYCLPGPVPSVFVSTIVTMAFPSFFKLFEYKNLDPFLVIVIDRFDPFLPYL